MHCKAFKALIGTVACIYAPICTLIRLIFYFFLLLTVSCLPRSFDVRMPSFLSHYWILILWWMYDATVKVMIKMLFFFSYLCDHVQTHIL